MALPIPVEDCTLRAVGYKALDGGATKAGRAACDHCNFIFQIHGYLLPVGRVIDEGLVEQESEIAGIEGPVIIAQAIPTDNDFHDFRGSRIDG